MGVGGVRQALPDGGGWRQEGCWEGLGSGGVRSAAIR